MNEGKPVPAGEAGAGSGEPGSEASGSVADGAVSSHDSGGDYELSLPVGPRPGGEANAEGDFELERPAPVPPGSGAEAEAPPEPSDTAPAGFGGAGAGAAGAEQEGFTEGVAPHPLGHAHDASADRPKPLHDPDPYSTPPYGEPGPWAPAPPVQHPAATPAHGTPAHGMAAPAAEPAQQAPGMMPTPTAATAPEPGMTTAPTPATAPAPGMMPMPPAPPAPEPAAAPAPAPVPSSSPPSTYDTAPYATATPWQNYDPWARQAPLQQSGAPVATQEQRRKRVRTALVLGAALIALVAGGVGGVVGAALERNGGFGDVRLPQAGEEPKGRAPDSAAGIAARALPSVVTLHVKGSAAEGTGTGFVLDDRGHILTNNHVVEAAGSGGEISVTFNGGETAKATIVGRDTGYDLAVVRVSGVRGLRPMPLGNSDNVEVGDPVVAIGAPFDLAGTVTSGIISAKERPITAGGEKGDGSDVSYVDALQTDAPINPGNSGGPLLDSKGRVVGINSAIRSADSNSSGSGQAGSIGLGFAIPVNQAKRVAEELINTGKATHPVIGVTLDMNYKGDGARVSTKSASGGPAVTANGPGDKAGIKPGDVITEVDGVRVHSGEELIVRTRAHRPGDRLELTVVRDGRQRTVTLVLGSADGN